MKVTPVTLEGEYVRLEPLRQAHARSLIEAASDGALWQTEVTIIPGVDGMGAYVQAALDGQASGRELPFVIVRRRGPGVQPTTLTDYEAEANQVVGTTRFYEISPNDRKCAIGYTWLAKRAQRTAVNTECKLLLLTHAFEMWKCVRVELITDVLNEQSRAAILRLGAKQEGILRKHLTLPTGRVRDSVFFSIIDDEWPDVKAGLIARLQAGQSGDRRLV